MRRSITPDAVGRQFATKIVVAAMEYRLQLPDDIDPVGSSAAGAEICYMLTHYVDRAAYGAAPAPVRAAVVDSTVVQVCEFYSHCLSQEGLPNTRIENQALLMRQLFNERQRTYAQCRAIMGEDPMNLLRLGTVYGVLGYYLQFQLGNLSSELDDSAILGHREPTEAEFDQSLLFFDAISLLPILTKAIGEMKLDRNLRSLR
jgi:hypothetical protein